MPSVIVATDLVKRYGDTLAVNSVSFEVRAGEVFGLLGPNGAGKTTTIEILEGLRRADTGTAKIFGVDVARNARAVRSRIGVQLQRADLYPLLTVRELIDLFTHLYPVTMLTERVLRLLGLARFAGARIGHLSTGQLRRVHVALALVNDPALIFLDEPTAGLDPHARRAVWDIVTALRGDGRTVFLTTHYMEEAERLCDRVVIMDRGTVIAHGSPSELIKSHFSETPIEIVTSEKLPNVPWEAIAGVTRVRRHPGGATLFTSDTGATLSAITALLPQHHAEPQELRVRRPTLEDVFLKVTGRTVTSGDTV